MTTYKAILTLPRLSVDKTEIVNMPCIKECEGGMSREAAEALVARLKDTEVYNEMLVACWDNQKQPRQKKQKLGFVARQADFGFAGSW